MLWTLSGSFSGGTSIQLVVAFKGIWAHSLIPSEHQQTNASHGSQVPEASVALSAAAVQTSDEDAGQANGSACRVRQAPLALWPSKFRGTVSFGFPF